MRRSLPCSLVLVALGAAAVPAAADARIVVGRSIAGVEPGDSKGAVRALLGPPASMRTEPSAIIGTVERWSFGKRRLGVSFSPDGRVISITTRSVKERTVTGVRVGVRRNTVLRKVAGATCSSTVCSVGRFEPGRIVTTFRLRRGKVESIDVGRVID